MKYAAFVLTLILPASTAFAQQMVAPNRPLTPLQVSSIEAIGAASLSCTISLHSSMHSSQINTSGPAISLPTSS